MCGDPCTYQAMARGQNGAEGDRQHLLPCALELRFLTARAAAGPNKLLELYVLISLSGCSFVSSDFLTGSSF